MNDFFGRALSMPIADVHAVEATVNATPSYYGVWPAGLTTQPKATHVMIHPRGMCNFSLRGNPPDATTGMLENNGVYVFSLHPSVHTIGLRTAADQSPADVDVHITWFSTREPNGPRVS